jgi:arginyl-tRNA synthetase
MIKKTLRLALDIILSEYIKKIGIDTLPQYQLEEPPKNIGSDLACNIAMLLAKQAKSNPRKIAEELVPLIAKSLSKYISKVEIKGAGFLNFEISEAVMIEELKNVLENKIIVPTKNKDKILIEFVSANPTGPLHIGHGRGAAIGDSLARVYSYLGYDIKREYYLNDVGNQIEMLTKSVEARYKELKGEKIEFPENGYKGEYIKVIAQKCIDNNSTDFRKAALEEMGGSITKDLADFSVSFDSWFSEGTITEQVNGKSKVDEVCLMLKEKGFAFEQDGALWFQTTKFGDDKDRVLKRGDGRYTYLASDVAYHENKIERGFDKLIDIWGTDHHGYVARMHAAMESLGKKKEDLIIILYQLVSLVRNGEPVKMSTRAGEFVTLKEVLDEVGKDACRFFFLLRAPDSQLEFDLELAKKQSKENPVYYVQYVHARCCSIFKEAQKTININELENLDNIDLSLLSTKEERDMIKKLIFFGDTLDLCIKSNSPHHITAYLMETADLFHSFYEKCKVLNPDNEKLSTARLSLVKAVKERVKQALELLGVSAPERM